MIAMGMLTVVMELELMVEFKKWCIDRKTTMSEVLRAYVTECVAQKKSDAKIEDVTVLEGWDGSKIELPQPCKLDLERKTLIIPNDTTDEDLLLLGSLLPQYVISSDNVRKTQRKMRIL